MIGNLPLAGRGLFSLARTNFILPPAKQAAINVMACVYIIYIYTYKHTHIIYFQALASKVFQIQLNTKLKLHIIWFQKKESLSKRNTHEYRSIITMFFLQNQLKVKQFYLQPQIHETLILSQSLLLLRNSLLDHQLWRLELTKF